MRVINWGGVLRLGVFGNLSLINSPMAKTVKMMGVYLKPMNAIGVPATANIPRRAAQLAAAGAIIARSPETIPSNKAIKTNMTTPSKPFGQCVSAWLYTRGRRAGED